MNKNKEQKKRQEMAIREQNESFRFQVRFAAKQGGLVDPELPELAMEADAICNNGLAAGMLALRDIVAGVRKDLGAEPVWGRCSLNGTLVPYVLGITGVAPEAGYVPGQFVPEELPFQVTMCYDNDVRNKVMDWIKEHNWTTSTLHSLPVAKLPGMMVTFRREVNKSNAILNANDCNRDT